VSSEAAPREFHPDWTISPARILAAVLRHRGISEAEFAALAMLGPETLHGVLTAAVPVDEHIAARIGEALSTGPETWLNLELRYRADLARGLADGTAEGGPGER
jgi:plasmid maintenance system antidote protein VapI